MNTGPSCAGQLTTYGLNKININHAASQDISIYPSSKYRKDYVTIQYNSQLATHHIRFMPGIAGRAKYPVIYVSRISRE